MIIERCCAFTGHRPKKFPWKNDENDSRCITLKRVMANEISKLADAGYTNFLSGMDEGTDTWTALAVLELRKNKPALKLHFILPCEGRLMSGQIQRGIFFYSGAS